MIEWRNAQETDYALVAGIHSAGCYVGWILPIY